MSDHIVVVGSGASAVHFAATVLQKGYRVTMIDMGRYEAPPETPNVPFSELKDQLDDPVRYFLGEASEGVVFPGAGKEYYGFPPGKQHVFERPAGFEIHADGFEPLLSFARGGLAETWTGGCYPFSDGDLEEFPFGYEALEARYAEVARRIGISGEKDDLARFLPVHDHLLPPLEFDLGSHLLMEAYRLRRSRLNTAYGAYLGRSRVATLPASRNGRSGCLRLNRCLWGCPVEALYTPRVTLRELQAGESFAYLAGREARYLRLGADGRAESLVCRRDDGEEEVLRFDHVVLAAGTLGSATIFLRTWREVSGATPVLTGLMDNRQVLMPFIQLRMIGRKPEARAYQYHLVGMGIEGEHPRDYIHCQITTLKAALLHPILQRLPFNLRTSVEIGRATLGALGIVNVNFADDRRSDCTVTLEDDALRIRYLPPPDESLRLRVGLRRVRRVLRELGCLAVPGLEHVRPMGASVHYSGLLPMTRQQAPFTTTPEGRSREIPNVYFADGSTFPFLPAKNLTFTLMANAVRIGEEVF